MAISVAILSRAFLFLEHVTFMLRYVVFVFSILFTAQLCAEESSFNDEIEYLPDAAATEAARKGERNAKRIQQRRKERGTAGRIAVDPQPRIATNGKNPTSLLAQARADARTERHAKRSRFLDAVIDALTPRVGVEPVVMRKHIGFDVVVKFGNTTDDDDIDDDDDWEDWDDELSARESNRPSKRLQPLTASEKNYIDRDSSQRGNRQALRERKQERDRKRER